MTKVTVELAVKNIGETVSVMAQHLSPITPSSAALTPARHSPGRSPGVTTRRPQVRHGLDAACTTLYVDTSVIPLAEVARYSASGLSEKDLSSAFATIAIFSGVAAVFLFGVIEIGWRANFLLEGALFGAIAICAVAEVFSARRQTLFTFEIETRAGAHATFVTADKDEALAVKAALDAACP